MTEPIKLDDNKIKFKVYSFYGNPQDENNVQLMPTFMKIRATKEAGMNLLIKLKRIREALAKEAEIVDKARIEIIEEFALKDEEDKPMMEGNGYVMPEEAEKLAALNALYLEFLNQDVELPFDKIKASQITGIESLKELDILEGVLDLEA